MPIALELRKSVIDKALCVCAQELEVKVDAELKAKKKAAEDVKVSIRQSLDKQMRDRKAREEREQAELDKQARIDGNKAIVAMRDAERKDAVQRQVMLEYRLQLEDQVRADVRERPGRQRRMTDLERAINVEEMSPVR